jgi:hypothetical protein
MSCAAVSVSATLENGSKNTFALWELGGFFGYPAKKG